MKTKKKTTRSGGRKATQARERGGRRGRGTPKVEQADVVVVGGGIAGLTCAVGLTGQGLRTVVVEAGRHPGGRAQSWTDPETGDPVHIGPHILLSEYPNMIRLMEMLGTADKVVWEEDGFITLVDGAERIHMRQSSLPAPMQFLPDLVTSRRLPHRHLLSNMPVTALVLLMDEEDFLRLDGMNAYAFLRRMGVSKTYIRTFWAFTCMSIMNVPIELCSAGALLRFFRRLLAQRAYRFGFPDGGLGDLFAPAAIARIEADGGRVLLETEVTAFAGAPDAVRGVVLADGRRIEARHTVAALPPSALRRLSHPAWLRAHPCFEGLVHFQPSPYISPFIWFDRKIADLKMWARVHDPNDLCCDFYDLSNIHTGWEARPSLITSNVIFAERAAHLSDEEVVRGTVDEIADHFPEARMDRVTHYVVNRIPMAIHCPFPGTERLRPTVRTPVPGLLRAGDWIRTGLPSSMESATLAGFQAAEILLEEMGRPERLCVPHDRIDPIPAMMRGAGRLRPTRPLRRWARWARRRLVGDIA